MYKFEKRIFSTLAFVFVVGLVCSAVMAAEGGKIDINTASEEELASLSGIGPAKAKAIISYRDENGAFKKTEDIINVTGIGQKMFDKIKDSITVEAEAVKAEEQATEEAEETEEAEKGE